MTVELGSVRMLGVDAVGRPGQRRFRLFAQTPRGSAIMWMEKEQLNSLSLTLDRFLAYLSEGQLLRTEARSGPQPTPGRMPADFPSPPNYELQVGQMKLSYDEEDSAFILSVIAVEVIMDTEQPQVILRAEDAISFLFSLRDAQELSTSITALVSAGRPVCPLCHAPLDGGPHACVKQNGHREILQIEESDGDA